MSGTERRPAAQTDPGTSARLLDWLDGKARGAVRRSRARTVRLGVPSGWFGWRHVEPEDLAGHADRLSAEGAAFRLVAGRRPERNPLPLNVAAAEDLPDTRGWWGYSMRDVPTRESGETALVTVPGARIVSYLDGRGEFYPGILSRDGRALDTREIKLRPDHGVALREAHRSGKRPLRLERATWVMERVYDNHSHWLTAHLPKLLMLREAGLLDEAILPRHLKPAMADSLDLLGIDAAALRRYDPDRVLEVDRLTIPVTDRFDPRLLRPLRGSMPRLTDRDPNRRIYISRARARFRKLDTEDEIWPGLEKRGFERIFMEDLTFREQVALMQETRVLVAPHGAGLTNMIFCPPGTLVTEIAWLGFPNPNFYAVAAAMGHDYVLVPAQSRGDVPELERNMSVAPEALFGALDPALDAVGQDSARVRQAG